MDITKTKKKKPDENFSFKKRMFLFLHVVINLQVQLSYLKSIVQLINKVNQLFHLEAENKIPFYKTNFLKKLKLFT